MIAVQNTLNENPERCKIGILTLKNAHCTATDAFLREIKKTEMELRSAYGHIPRAELKGLHPMNVFIEYYRKFGYGYHVLGQLESVVKGKEIPDAQPLVTAMFMAELKNMLLTAGHDLDKVGGPLKIASATGRETYETINGKTVTTVSRDIMVLDQESVLSSILRGPDRRTSITASTNRVLYMVYAPQSISETLVYRHLDDIAGYVMKSSKDALAEIKAIF